MVEEPLRVLVVEDRPRWEWRFLKTALDADKERVRADHLIFSADRRVAQQRPDMLLRFPDDGRGTSAATTWSSSATSRRISSRARSSRCSRSMSVSTADG